jgi:hypothetical protein
MGGGFLWEQVYPGCPVKYIHIDSVKFAGSTRRKTDLVLNTFVVIALNNRPTLFSFTTQVFRAPAQGTPRFVLP